MVNDMEPLVAQSIEDYNHLRPFLNLGMKTPEEVHKKASCDTQLASLKPVNVFQDEPCDGRPR
jgi:hypothetical protein